MKKLWNWLNANAYGGNKDRIMLSVSRYFVSISAFVLLFTIMLISTNVQG